MNKRHLNIDFKKLQKGQHIFTAPQSCNKSGSLESLAGEDVLLICARNSLLAQLKDRMPQTIQMLHYEMNLDGSKSYFSKDDIANSRATGHGCNYSSLYKYSNFADKERKFRFAIVDEPILLWAHSTGYKPSWKNESEYLARLIHTPVVIYLGADFPPHILEEIEEIGEMRGEPCIYKENEPYAPEFEIAKDKRYYQDLYIDDDYSYAEPDEDLDELLGWR